MNHSLRKRQLQEGTIDVAGERRQRRIGLRAVPVHTGYGCRMSATGNREPSSQMWPQWYTRFYDDASFE